MVLVLKMRYMKLGKLRGVVEARVDLTSGLLIGVAASLMPTWSSLTVQVLRSQGSTAVAGATAGNGGRCLY